MSKGRPERHKEYRATSIGYRERERIRSRNRHCKSREGNEHLQAQLLKQAGCCAICGEPLIKPCFDHNHDTLQLRGVLCDPCNRGLGCFKEDTERLSKAISYIKVWASVS